MSALDILNENDICFIASGYRRLALALMDQDIAPAAILTSLETDAMLLLNSLCPAEPGEGDPA